MNTFKTQLKYFFKKYNEFKKSYILFLIEKEEYNLPKIRIKYFENKESLEEYKKLS